MSATLTKRGGGCSMLEIAWRYAPGKGGATLTLTLALALNLALTLALTVTLTLLP